MILGLNPYDYVILKMDVTNGRGRSFLSFAKFQADATGLCNVKHMLHIVIDIF